MAKIFIPNNLTRPQLDAFRSIEAELNRLANGGSVATGAGAPTITSNLQDGSLYYDYVNLNLYVFRSSDNTWNQSKNSGLPFVNYTKLGFNAPALNSDTWSEDTVIAVSDFTGRTYTNQKEFGYGTVVVITYDDIKLAGRFKSVNGTDTWIAPGAIIDGDLIVDGTISADQIQANAVKASKLDVDGYINITSSSGGALVSGKSSYDSNVSGFFLGVDDNIAKFKVGGLTQSIEWDGGRLRVIGDILTSGNVVSIDSTKVSFKRYKLDGTNGRVDATLGEDKSGTSPDKYYWQTSDDEEAAAIATGQYTDSNLSNRYLFQQITIRSSQFGRGLYPEILDTSGNLVPSASYEMEYQFRGTLGRMYPHTYTSTTDVDGMYNGGDMYGSLAYGVWSPFVEGTIFPDTASNQVVDVRVTHTGSETLGTGSTRIRAICYASGHDHQLETGSVSSVALGSSDFNGVVYEKIESVQITANSGTTPVICTAQVSGSNVTARAFNASGSAVSTVMFVSVRGY